MLVGVLSLPLIAACELDEVQIASGEEIVVVHAVVRPDADQQVVLVERALNGRIVFAGLGGAIPPTRADLPIEDATVMMANLDLPQDTCGSPVVFIDEVRIAAGTIWKTTPGVYWSPSGCPTMRPGDRLELTVLVGSEIITGVTHIPNVTDASLTIRGSPVSLQGDTSAFNRDNDTLQVAVDGEFFRGLEIFVRRTGTGPPELEVSGPVGSVAPEPDPTLATIVDSAAMDIPGTIRHVFSLGTGEATFLGGRRYSLVVGVLDTNYFDFRTTEANRLTGRGFRNRLTGGVGVFGSMVVLTRTLNVTADTDDPREGGYHIEGQVNGVDVALDITVYLGRTEEPVTLSAFVTGQWLQLSEGAWAQRDLRNQSVDGSFAGDTLRLTIPTYTETTSGKGVERGLVALVLTGVPQSAGAFQVALTELLPLGEMWPLATLEGTRN
jgi:hypothetical protein